MTEEKNCYNCGNRNYHVYYSTFTFEAESKISGLDACFID